MFGKEPAVVLNAIAEVVRAVIPMLIVFRVIEWTDQQIAAVFLVVGVSVTGIVTVVTRSQTVSHETANKQIEVATRQPAGTPVEVVKGLVNN